MGPAIRMVRELQNAERQLNRQLNSQKLQLLDSSKRCIDADAPPPRRVFDADAETEASEHLFYDGEPEDEEEQRAGAQTNTDTDSSEFDSGEATGDRVLQHLQGSSVVQHSLAELVYGHPKNGLLVSPETQKKKGKAASDGKLSLFEEDSDGNTSASDGEETDGASKSKGLVGSWLFGNLPLPPSASGLSADFESGDAPEQEAAAIYRAMGVDPENPSDVEAFWTPEIFRAIKVGTL